MELKLRTIVMAYKIYTEQTPIDLASNLSIFNLRRSERFSTVPKLNVPSYTIVAAKRAFRYQAAILLNEACEKLKVNLLSPITLVKFKYRLRREFVDSL